MEAILDRSKHADMEKLLEQFKNTPPAVVFEWKDRETDAEGWVVINSLRGGAAGGGTRMRLGCTREEVLSLAKTMEIKFTVSGPPIGGAKSGINFDPSDPRKRDVLTRWYKAVFPLLKNYYGTGGDLNVDELRDVIPITEDFGLWHPQEGVVEGHFQPTKAQKIHQVGQLRQGVSKVVEDPNYTPDIAAKYKVADLVTGWGVAESVKHFYDIYKDEDLKGKKVIVQGWGNVAGAAGYYLTQSGAKIVGIIDRAGGLINEEGYDFEETRKLLVNRENNQITADGLLSFDEVNEKIWNIEADIFIPCAASKLITREQIDGLINKGLQCVSCGANVPFVDDKVFFGDTARYTDERISLIPDFIANCGMARVFAYLMGIEEVEITDEAIFTDVSNIIQVALERSYAHSDKPTNIATTSLSLALEQLV